MADDPILKDWETLLVGLKDRVCTVTLNRPEKLNAMSQPMRRELALLFEEIGRSDRIRSVILTGAGRAFSAGGDINDFKTDAEAMHDLMRLLSHRWFKALWGLPQPVIGAINGVAAGGGCSLALACDLVFASTEACFIQTFQKIGLVPDLGGLFLLPRLVGLHRAKELTLLGDPIDAQQALEFGLVNRVLAPGELISESEQVARRLARQPARASTLTKRILNRSFESSMEEILDSEWMAQSFLFGTRDNREGVAAFLAKSAGKPENEGEL